MNNNVVSDVLVDIFSVQKSGRLNTVSYRPLGRLNLGKRLQCCYNAPAIYRGLYRTSLYAIRWSCTNLVSYIVFGLCELFDVWTVKCDCSKPVLLQFDKRHSEIESDGREDILQHGSHASVFSKLNMVSLVADDESKIEIHKYLDDWFYKHSDYDIKTIWVWVRWENLHLWSRVWNCWMVKLFMTKLQCFTSSPVKIIFNQQMYEISWKRVSTITHLNLTKIWTDEKCER